MASNSNIEQHHAFNTVPLAPPSRALADEMEALAQAEFSPHPFAVQVTHENVRQVLRNYLTMALAFPYLQAGASQRLIAERLIRGDDIGPKAEATSAVAAFLVSDELGVHAKVLRGGTAALPDILETTDFHANILRQDISGLLGDELKPEFSDITRGYLHALADGLSACDDVKRAAYMVAFERHAAVMITSLWDCLKALFPSKKRLTYFEIHVGGDDPAEPYHVAMTEKMLAIVLEEGDEARFLDEFRYAYGLNVNWCHEICL